MDKEQTRKSGSLGRDFLTFLCYKSDESGGQIENPATKEQFVCLVDGKIVLENDNDIPPCSITYAGDGFSERDLKQALRAGKRVREARLRVEKGENTWEFTLKADRLEVSGLKISMPPAREAEERFYGRMYSIEGLHALLDAYFEYFVGEINAKTWKNKGFKQFQDWLQS